jgi:adenylosuccinate lyase
MFVYPEAMERNLALTRGLVFSQPVLLLLAKSGLTRENSYSIVQRNAMKVWELAASGGEPNVTFRSLLERDPDILGRLSKEDLDGAFDPRAATRFVDRIFERVGL